MQTIAYYAIITVGTILSAKLGIAFIFGDKNEKRKAIFNFLLFVLGVVLGVLWAYKF